MKRSPARLFDGDPELLARFRRGDRETLARVYWAYRHAVERLVRRCLAAVGSTHVVYAGTEDLVQDVFVRAFGGGSRRAYDGTRDYAPYLFAIARNVVADLCRLRQRDVLTAQAHLDFPVAGEQPACWPELADAADPRALALIRRYVAQLPPELGAVHHQRNVVGLSQQAAARVLGISRQQLRTIEARIKDGAARQLAAALPSARAAGELGMS